MEGQARVYAIADEDLGRENDEKTSAVHFVRFELTRPMKDALKSGAQMILGFDHPNYPAHLEELQQETLACLIKDLSYGHTAHFVVPLTRLFCPCRCFNPAFPPAIKPPSQKR